MVNIPTPLNILAVHNKGPALPNRWEVTVKIAVASLLLLAILTLKEERIVTVRNTIARHRPKVLQLISSKSSNNNNNNNNNSNSNKVMENHKHLLLGWLLYCNFFFPRYLFFLSLQLQPHYCYTAAEVLLRLGQQLLLLILDDIEH